MYGDKEASVVISFTGEPLLWWLPEGRSVGYIPPVLVAGGVDVLMQYILDNHDRVWGVAHTHPGSGITGPSSIDIDTFAAVERAISTPYPAKITRLPWWIATFDDLVVCQWEGPGPRDYGCRPMSPRWQSRHLNWLGPLRAYTENDHPEPEEG